MGRPKQLLPVGNRPLLRQVAEGLLGPPVTALIVVLGANAKEIAGCLEGLSVHVVINDGWEEGMGSSIRVGMEALAAVVPDSSGVVIALGDQPEISAIHVNRLLEVHRKTGRSIVASEFGGKLMPPAFFSANYLPSLRALRGDAGARSLFGVHVNDIATVATDQADDLDTAADYAAYLERLRSSESQAQ